MRRAYGLDVDAPVDALRAIAGAWGPYRTWVALLLRRGLEDGLTPGGPAARPPRDR